MPVKLVHLISSESYLSIYLSNSMEVVIWSLIIWSLSIHPSISDSYLCEGEISDPSVLFVSFKFYNLSLLLVWYNLKSPPRFWSLALSLQTSACLLILESFKLKNRRRASRFLYSYSMFIEASTLLSSDCCCIGFIYICSIFSFNLYIS